MVLPILAGAGAGILGMLVGSGTKKETSIVQHAPYETYAPTSSYQIQYPDYNIVMNSPFASAGSKKEMAAEQTPTVSPIGGGYTEKPIDLFMPALILGAGIVAYGVVSKK